MKASLEKQIVVFSIACLLLSGCGTGQLFGPTITPSPTITSTPTSTPTPTLTPTPTVTLTPTPEPVQWDISPIYIETINFDVMEVLPIQVSLETDSGRGGYKYGLREGWANNSGQPAKESLAEMWARGIFEAWWYNTNHETDPTIDDFKAYVQEWANCQKKDATGEDSCWKSIQFELVANDLHTYTYHLERMTINPPSLGRIVFTSDSSRIRNMMRGIGGCENAYGTNYLDGVLILYVGKAEGCLCRNRAASMASRMTEALIRLQTRYAFSKNSIGSSESLYPYVSRYRLSYRGGVSDSRFILREKFTDADC